MSSPTGSITTMIERLSDGDYSVVEPLLNRFWPRLKREAAKKFGRRTLRVVDEEDIAQCVFHDVVKRIAENRIDEIRNRRRLWRLMEISTFHTVVNMHRWDERSGAAVRNSDDLPVHTWHDESVPGFSVSLEDDLDKLSGLIDENAKTIVIMIVHGYESSEIAKRLRLSPRTIQRKLAAIRDAWKKINQDEWR